MQTSAIRSVGSSFPSEEPRERCGLFKCLSGAASSCWQRLRPSSIPFQSIARSLLGKVFLYTIADTAGAVIGGRVGGSIIGRIGSSVGYCLGFGMPLVGLAGIQAIRSSQMERISKLFIALVSMSTSAALVVYVEDVANYGDYAGSSIGNIMGVFAGTISGGYVGLYLAGSPASWDLYSKGTARFLGVGMAFKGMIVCPDTWIAMPLILLHRISCVSVQVFAYNTPEITRAVSFYIKNRKDDGLEFSIIRPIVNHYSGHSAEFLSKELSKSISSLIAFALTKSLPLTTQCFGMLLSGSAESVFTSSIQNSMRGSLESAVIGTPHFIMNSMHNYIIFLNRSSQIQDAYKAFEVAFFERTDHEGRTNEAFLIEAIKGELRKQSNFFTLYETAFQSILTPEIENNLISDFRKLVRDMEVELVGCRLLKSDQISYLGELLRIHLSLYLIFTSINYKNFLPSSGNKEKNRIEEDPNADKEFLLINKIEEKGNFERIEESEFFAMMIRLFFQYYVSAVTPTRVSTGSHMAVHGILTTTYRIQRAVTDYFRPPEQKAHLIHPIGPIDLMEENEQPGESTEGKEAPLEGAEIANQNAPKPVAYEVQKKTTYFPAAPSPKDVEVLVDFEPIGGAFVVLPTLGPQLRHRKSR